MRWHKFKPTQWWCPLEYFFNCIFVALALIPSGWSFPVRVRRHRINHTTQTRGVVWEVEADSFIVELRSDCIHSAHVSLVCNCSSLEVGTSHLVALTTCSGCQASSKVAKCKNTCWACMDHGGRLVRTWWLTPPTWNFYVDTHSTQCFSLDIPFTSPDLLLLDTSSFCPLESFPKLHAIFFFFKTNIVTVTFWV